MNITQLNDSQYDFAKRLVQVIIPAISAAYFALGNIWGLPAVENVVGTLAVIATFLGTLLGLSSKAYTPSADGDAIVIADPGGMRTVSLELNEDPESIIGKDTITFNVKTSQAPQPPTE